MTEQDTKLKVITVMDPMMCMTCKHAHVADVLFSDGSTKKMFYCSRLDCDNWCTEPAKAASKKKKAA